MLGFTKISALSAACASMFLLQGCSEKIDARQIQEMKGLIYKLNYADPFTGTVSNYSMPGILTSPGTCVLQVKKGKLDGATICTLSNGAKFSETQYDDGLKNGLEQIWNSQKGILTSKIEWKNGKHDGVEESYDAVTGKKISLANWSNDQKNGEEKRWDATSQTLLLSFQWKDGRNTGFSKINGEEKNYKNGQLDGFYRENANGYEGGRVEANYKDGVCIGPKKTWDKNNVLRDEVENCEKEESWHRTWNEKGALVEAVHHKVVDNQYIKDFQVKYDGDGKIVSEECYVGGSLAFSGCPTPSFLSAVATDHGQPSNSKIAKVSSEQCIAQKTAAFRKEQGEDALINADVLGEWEQACKAL